jgi:hypothetical protein
MSMGRAMSHEPGQPPSIGIAHSMAKAQAHDTPGHVGTSAMTQSHAMAKGNAEAEADGVAEASVDDDGMATNAGTSAAVSAGIAD